MNSAAISKSLTL